VRVSLLLPCRNAAPHLAEALASLFAQAYRDFEVIAVDDASTDATPAILESWRARLRALRVVRGEGRGIVPALDAAVTQAGGELLARMDADDVADPERLARQVAALDADPALAGCGTAVRYFPENAVRDGARRYQEWLNSLTSPELVRRDRFVECPLAHPTLLVRRSAFERVGGYRDPDWPEDYDLVLRLLAAECRLTNLPAVLHHWRERPDRLSRTDPRYSEDAFRRCKLRHLLPLLEGRDGVVVWGAGPVGKSFARGLMELGVPVRAFVDLDPRKVGQTVHGAPVVAPARINDYRGAFALAAVAGPGPRAEIRESLTAAGWAEGADFIAVA
jgi:glycosyltransferase involved in cell wall biosynthesis